MKVTIAIALLALCQLLFPQVYDTPITAMPILLAAEVVGCYALAALAFKWLPYFFGLLLFRMWLPKSLRSELIKHAKNGITEFSIDDRYLFAYVDTLSDLRFMRLNLFQSTDDKHEYSMPLNTFWLLSVMKG